LLDDAEESFLPPSAYKTPTSANAGSDTHLSFGEIRERSERAQTAQAPK